MSEQERLSPTDAEQELAAKRQARKERLAAYAEAMAGTEFDLDPVLERAGIECLLSAVKPFDEVQEGVESDK